MEPGDGCAVARPKCVREIPSRGCGGLLSAHVAFFYGGGAALLAGVLAGLAYPRSRRRAWILVGLGVLVAAAFFVWQWSQASRDGLACHDCTRFLGRYWEPHLVIFFALLNLAAWSLGVAIGTAAGAMQRARRELRDQRRASPARN